jgi:hypothetical protein
VPLGAPRRPPNCPLGVLDLGECFSALLIVGATVALGLVFHPFGPCKPVVAIIVRIDDGNAKLLGEADVLVLAQFVFLKRMDVGVVKKR